MHSMEDLVKLCKKFLPAFLLLTRADDSTKRIAVPNIRKKWEHCVKQLQGEPWVKLELLDKKEGVLVTVEREDADLGAGAPVNLPGPDLAATGGNVGLVLQALHGLGNMILTAVRFGMEEQRRGNSEVMDRALSVLNITAGRLEGWEKSGERLMKLAFDVTKAQAEIAGGGGDGESNSGGMLKEFLGMVNQGKEDAIREEVEKRVADELRKRAAGGQPAAGSNGVPH